MRVLDQKIFEKNMFSIQSLIQKGSFFLFILFLVFFPFDPKLDKIFHCFSKSLYHHCQNFSQTLDKKIFFYPTEIFVLALFFLSFFEKRKKLFASEKTLLIFYGFLGLSLLGTPVDLSYAQIQHFVHWVISGLLFYWLLHSELLEKNFLKVLKVVAVVFFFAAIFESVLSIVQYFSQHSLGLKFLGEPVLDPKNTQICSFSMPNGKKWLLENFFFHEKGPKDLIRAYGTLGHPNLLGGFFFLTLIFSYLLFLYCQKFWKKLLLVLGIFLQTFALALTFSRSALLSFLVLCPFWLFVVFWKTTGGDKSFLKNVKLLCLVFVCSSALSLVLLKEQYEQRGGIGTENTLAKESDQKRLTDYRKALSLIKKFPLLGVGLKNFTVFLEKEKENPPFYPPHNIYLLIGVEGGLLSLFAFLFFVFLLFREAWKIFFSPILFTGCILFGGVLLIGCFDFYPLVAVNGRWMFFLLAGLLGRMVRTDLRSEVFQPDRPAVL